MVKMVKFFCVCVIFIIIIFLIIISRKLNLFDVGCIFSFAFLQLDSFFPFVGHILEVPCFASLKHFTSKVTSFASKTMP